MLFNAHHVTEDARCPLYPQSMMRLLRRYSLLFDLDDGNDAAFSGRRSNSRTACPPGERKKFNKTLCLTCRSRSSRLMKTISRSRGCGLLPYFCHWHVHHVLIMSASETCGKCVLFDVLIASWMFHNWLRHAFTCNRQLSKMQQGHYFSVRKGRTVQ